MPPFLQLQGGEVMEKQGAGESSKLEDNIGEGSRKKMTLGDGSEDSGAKWSREFDSDEEEEDQGKIQTSQDKGKRKKRRGWYLNKKRMKSYGLFKA